jgi:hypothetical protein
MIGNQPVTCCGNTRHPYSVSRGMHGYQRYSEQGSPTFPILDQARPTWQPSELRKGNKLSVRSRDKARYMSSHYHPDLPESLRLKTCEVNLNPNHSLLHSLAPFSYSSHQASNFIPISLQCSLLHHKPLDFFQNQTSPPLFNTSILVSYTHNG